MKNKLLKIVTLLSLFAVSLLTYMPVAASEGSGNGLTENIVNTADVGNILKWIIIIFLAGASILIAKQRGGGGKK